MSLQPPTLQDPPLDTISLSVDVDVVLIQAEIVKSPDVIWTGGRFPALIQSVVPPKVRALPIFPGPEVVPTIVPWSPLPERSSSLPFRSDSMSKWRSRGRLVGS